ncbi:hypothetical protein M9H77_03345 [Catharanthus roseus]|uniref:Uncharacterized protein n=1 Tax=Catharanthus roseus TaxID=4058 RepID=A0ACC0CAZ5_CATRO|nr:hypothetical protein M9H77_03345 [Catharanthus roseus]
MLVDELDALLSYSLLSLECLGNVHDIDPFNASNSKIAHLLWLFEGIDSRTNLFIRGKNDLAWQVIGAQEGEFRGTKALLFSRMQVEDAKGASSEGFRASTLNEVKDTPIADSKSSLPSPAGFCSWRKSLTYRRL